MVTRRNISSDWCRVTFGPILPNEDPPQSWFISGAGACQRQCGAEEYVRIVGGGNSAGQVVMYLLHMRKSTMPIRGDTLAATLSQHLIDR